MNKIIVIGSNCFSGAWFVNHCLEQNHEVVGISRSAEYPSIFLPYKKNSNLGNFCFFKADLNQDHEFLVSKVQEFQPELIVNFAAQGMVGESWQNPIHWFNTNTIGHIRLHDQIRKFSFIQKYVHISTPEVYGSCEGKVTENQSFNPSTPYAVSKASCDMSLMTFHKTYDFPVVWTRAANVYGAHQALYRIIPKTILSILSGNRLPLHGGGYSIRSFIHIKDVARATYQIAMNSNPGEVYHLSTDRFISIRDLVNMICQKLNVSFETSVEISEDRPGKDTAYVLDSSKIRNKFGWSDLIGLESGIDETIQWVKENYDQLITYPNTYIHKE